MGNPVLVHYHIFKNAGSSIDHILRSNLGERWATFEGSSATDVVSSQRLASFLASRPDIRAVSSHLSRPPLPHAEAFPIVFLRHPIERCRSVYTFVRFDPAQPNHQVAATKGLAGYVEWALDSDDGGNVICDYQVIHLSEASFRWPNICLARPGASDLREAQAWLAEWSVFGLVHRFDESCRLFQHRYRDAFPGLDMTPVHANRTNMAYQDDESEIAMIREELGHDLYQRLLDRNALDLELFEFARSRFEEALREMDAAA